MKKAKSIMIQGTMSNAGKSLLCAGLCRVFHQDGYKVAPFKSQNMALNSFITKEGLEMGRAQVVQAEAAGVEPDVRMNPILLKPTSDVGSQVIVRGQVLSTMPAREYFAYKHKLTPSILEAYDSLAAENDIIVLEGAGSPAEINLKQQDIVNMGMARMAGAPVLLAGDIDRGGVFASLYGTVALLEEEERQRIRGLIVNKFRGDVEILRPGLSMLENLTRVPVVGVVPYLSVDIEEEDSLAARLDNETPALVDIAVIRLPRLSNFTDFAALERTQGVGVRYVSRAAQLGEPDLIILPGTKNTMGDLRWLRESGLEGAILKKESQGVPILGICGGYQMLGQVLRDPLGVEEGGSLRGLGLLPIETDFLLLWKAAPSKATRSTWGRPATFPATLPQPSWERNGRSRMEPPREMCWALMSMAFWTGASLRRSWFPCSLSARAWTLSRWSKWITKPTKSSSMTFWPTPSGAVWIWTRCIRYWKKEPRRNGHDRKIGNTEPGWYRKAQL